MKKGKININVASLIGYTAKYEKVEDGVDEETGETKYKEVPIKPNKVKLEVKVDEVTVESKEVSEDETNVAVSFNGEGTVRIKVIIDNVQRAVEDLNLNNATEINIK